MTPPNTQPLITHVPSQEELVAAAELNAHHDPEHALRPEQVEVLFRGLEYDTPGTRSVASKTNPTAPAGPAIDTSTSHEPFIEPEEQRTLHGQELSQLREQYAK